MGKGGAFYTTHDCKLIPTSKVNIFEVTEVNKSFASISIGWYLRLPYDSDVLPIIYCPWCGQKL